MHIATLFAPEAEEADHDFGPMPLLSSMHLHGFSLSVRLLVDAPSRRMPKIGGEAFERAIFRLGRVGGGRPLDASVATPHHAAGSS